MPIADFKLERFFARYEFAVPYLLCASDIEPYRLPELLALADDECRDLWDDLSLGYTESAGHPLLRAAIAESYAGLTAENVLVSGAEEAIFLFLNTVLGPGDHAVVVWPAYQSHFAVARATGAAVSLVALDEGAGWALDLDALRAALRPTTRAILVNFPHNPTGALPDRATFDALVVLAREAGVWLFSDEVYRDLEVDPADRLPAAVEVYERGVSFGAMSKTFALAGLRIGWLASHDAALLDRLVRYKDYTTICNSAPSEVLALIALRAREQILARNRAILATNLAHLDRFFVAYPEIATWTRPRAGSIGFPQLRPDWPIDSFTDELVREAGVLLLPGSVFDHPGNRFRLGFGRTNLPEALARLEGFVVGRGGR